MDHYQQTKEVLENRIRKYKNVITFRNTFYSYFIDIRREMFRFSYEWLTNECVRNNSQELASLTNMFVDFNAAMNIQWWRLLASTYSETPELQDLISLWIDGMPLRLDTNIDDTVSEASLGLR